MVCGITASLWLCFWPSGYESTYPFLFGRWSAFNLKSTGILVVMAVLIISVSVGLAKAYQSPHPQIIATFDYAYLIFAAFWGFVFFREVPGVWTIVGMVLIIIAGILALLGNQSTTDQ